MLAETRRITLPLLLMTAATPVVASQEPVKKEFPTLGTVDPTAAVERHWKYDYATGEITPIALPPKGTLLIEPQSKSSGTANLDVRPREEEVRRGEERPDDPRELVVPPAPRRTPSET